MCVKCAPPSGTTRERQDLIGRRQTKSVKELFKNSNNAAFFSKINVKFAGVISPCKNLQILDVVHNLCKI